jgi:hypothetical protein
MSLALPKLTIAILLLQFLSINMFVLGVTCSGGEFIGTLQLTSSSKSSLLAGVFKTVFNFITPLIGVCGLLNIFLAVLKTRLAGIFSLSPTISLVSEFIRLYNS